MQSRSFRVLSTFVALLLLAGLIGAVYLVLRDNPLAPAYVPTTPALRAAAATFTPAATAEVTLGNLQRIAAGGYAFRPVDEAVLEIDGGTVNLAPGDGATSSTAVYSETFRLEGSPVLDLATGQPVTDVDSLFAAIASQLVLEELLDVGAPAPVDVGGRAGLSAMVGRRDGPAQLAGRLVVVLPSDDQAFVMLAVAPADQWTAGRDAQFTAVMESVTFFPSAAVAQAAETPRLRPSPTATVTAVPTIAFRLTPMPTPTPVPSPAPSGRSGWLVYSNGDFANDLIVYSNSVWLATDGGVVSWNKGSASSVTFTTLDGLSTNRAVAAANCPLTGLGLVFGGDRGLQVFDTRNGAWKVLNSANTGMSFDDVATLNCSVAFNYLLVGYRQHGLDILDANSGLWTYIGEEAGLQYDTIRAVTVVGNLDQIWVASDLGVSVLTRDTAELYDASNSPLGDAPINVMVTDPADAVWLGGQDAVYRFADQEWTVYSRGAATGGATFPAGPFTGLAVAEDGGLWLGSQDGEVCRFDPASELCIELYRAEPGMAPGPLSGLRTDAAGNPTYVTYGNGFSAYDGVGWKQFQAADRLLAGNSVRALTQDDDGFVWIATNAGAQQTSPTDDPVSRLFTADNSALPGNDVVAAGVDAEGDTWLGAAGQGVVRLDGAGGTLFTTTDGLVSNDVTAVAVDRQGRVWLGTRAGLSIWNGSAFFNLTVDNGLPNDEVLSLLGSGDSMWIGTNGGGLYRFERNQLQVFNSTNVDLPSDIVTALAALEDGDLWVGTDRGLVRFDDGVITPVAEVPDGRIRAIAVTPGGETWVAMQADGLYHSAGAVWEHMTENLPADTVTALLVDAYDTLWIGGETGGLMRYQLQE